MVIPVPIVSVLFERGAFAAADTWPTALAVADLRRRPAGLRDAEGALAALLRPRGHPLPLPLRRLGHDGERRRSRSASPRFIGFIAAALGTTVAGWIMLWQLWRGTRPMGDMAAADARLRRAAPRIALACAPDGRRPPRRRPPPRAQALARPAPPLRRPRAPRRPRHRRLRRRRLRHRRHAPRRPPRRDARGPRGHETQPSADQKRAGAGRPARAPRPGSGRPPPGGRYAAARGRPLPARGRVPGRDGQPAPLPLPPPRFPAKLPR